MRKHAHNPRSTDSSNPYNAMIMQLSGINRGKRPRCKAPVNIWCKHPESIKAIQDEWDKIGSTVDPKKRAAKRAELASTLFKNLPAETKQHYADCAKQEHDAALQKWEQASMGEISTAPADHQRYVLPPYDTIAETDAPVIIDVSLPFPSSFNRGLTLSLTQPASSSLSLRVDQSPSGVAVSML